MTTANPTDAARPLVEVDEKTSAAAPPKSRRMLILGAIATAIAAVSIGWWVTHRGLESTDNAQIDADVVSVAARTGGTVVQVLFNENQHVKAGDLLALIDDEPAKAKLAQAEANLQAAEAAAVAAEADAALAETNAVGNKSVADASLQTASVSAATAREQIHEAEASVHAAEASFAQAETDRARTRDLFEKGAVARALVDQSETAYNLAISNLEAARARLATLRGSAAQASSRIVEASAKAKQVSNVDAIVAQARARAQAARAQVATAGATRDLAQLELSYTRITAPTEGTASKKTIAVGQTVAAGQPVVQLVPPTLWVTANFKETQVAHMHAGQHAHFDVDAFPGVKLDGELESLSGATGSRFTLLPPDNASGNFTKVIQRVPVRVKITHVPQNVELRPGMSVELTVDTRG